MSHELIAERMLRYFVLLNFRDEIHHAEKHTLRHVLVYCFDDSLNTIDGMVILVEVDYSNFTLFYILCGPDQIDLPLVIDLVCASTRCIECFIFSKTLLLHKLLHFLVSDSIAGDRVEGH